MIQNELGYKISICIAYFIEWFLYPDLSLSLAVGICLDPCLIYDDFCAAYVLKKGTPFDFACSCFMTC